MNDAAEPRPAAGPERPSAPLVLEVASRRRSPRYGVFIGLGVTLGVAVAFFLTFSRPETEFSYLSVLGYTALGCGLVGGLIGGLVAVLLDRGAGSR